MHRSLSTRRYLRRAYIIILCIDVFIRLFFLYICGYHPVYTHPPCIIVAPAFCFSYIYNMPIHVCPVLNIIYNNNMYFYKFINTIYRITRIKATGDGCIHYRISARRKVPCHRLQLVSHIVYTRSVETDLFFPEWVGRGMRG